MSHMLFLFSNMSDGQCFQRYSISHFSLPSYVVAVVLLGQIRVNERISESFPANYIIPCAHGTMNFVSFFHDENFRIDGFPIDHWVLKASRVSLRALSSGEPLGAVSLFSFATAAFTISFSFYRISLSSFVISLRIEIFCLLISGPGLCTISVSRVQLGSYLFALYRACTIPR